MAQTRNLDTVARMIERAQVPQWIMRSMVLGAGLWLLGAFGMWLAQYSNRPELLLSFFAPQMPIVLGMVWLCWSTLRPSSIAARLGLLLLCLLTLFWIASGVYMLHLKWGAGPKWLVVAVFQLAFLTLLAIEVAFGAWTLLRASRADAALVDETRPALAMIGAPPALGQLTGGRIRPRLLFLLASFFFMLAALQALGLLVAGDLNWQLARDNCASGVAEAKAACVDQFANMDLLGQFVVWPATFVLAIWLGIKVQSAARRRTRDTAAEAMSRNKVDKPILFLRAFENDQVEVMPRVRSPLRWLLGRTRPQHFLDHMLVEEFASFGPTVALGRPGKPAPSFGVWRTFMPNATPAQWQAEVIRLATNGHAIVMVVDDSQGVAWEIGYIARAQLTSKTIFTAPPHFCTPAANRALWQRVHAQTGIQAFDLAANSAAPVLAVFFPANGEPAIATATTFTASAYLAALRWFFRDRSRCG